MRIFVYPPIFQKAYLVAMCLGLSLCLLSKSEAIITVDSSNSVYHDDADSNNEAYFFYYDIAKSDSDLDGTFLETKASSGSTLITAYNDGDGIANTPNDNMNTTTASSFTLAQAGSFTYNGSEWVTFYLDANQQGGTFYDVDKLEIYTSANSQVDGYDTPGTNNVTDGNLAYSWNKEDNGGDVLSLFYGNGASNWDVALYVPLDQFITIDTDSSVHDAEETYIQFYVEYTDTGGPDTWGYDRGADIIPEPSSALLVSLGGLMSLVRRRR
jgi:hypothetical protein